MKAYLVTTGTLFTLISLAHIARAIAESARFASDPWFWLEGPGLGLVSGALGFWAFRLLRQKGQVAR
jgi:hypothetical protein